MTPLDCRFDWIFREFDLGSTRVFAEDKYSRPPSVATPPFELLALSWAQSVPAVDPDGARGTQQVGQCANLVHLDERHGVTALIAHIDEPFTAG